jgi:hypothetical protein
MTLRISTRKLQRKDRKFGALYHGLAETGTLATVTADRGTMKFACTLDVEESILITFYWRRKYQHETIDGNVPCWSYDRLEGFHAQVLYLYHLRRVHVLTPADYPPRENFSPWFIHHTANLFFV